MVDDDDIEPVSSDYINDTEPRKTEFVNNDPSPLIPHKTKAQIWEDTVIQFFNIYLCLQQIKIIKCFIVSDIYILKYL